MAGLAPIPQFEVREDGALVARVDLAWPEARLAIEYEGAYHFEGSQIIRDDARLDRLAAAGWRVIRLSAADLDAVVARVREALGLSGTRP
jgi:very-short-patch-repair endonuclease